MQVQIALVITEEIITFDNVSKVEMESYSDIFTNTLIIHHAEGVSSYKQYEFFDFKVT